jgi:hypothetical protein
MSDSDQEDLAGDGRDDEVSEITMNSVASSTTTSTTTTAPTIRGFYVDNAVVWAHAEKRKSMSQHDDLENMECLMGLSHSKTHGMGSESD